MDAEDIVDLFSAFGPVRTRRMFGGKGIYSGATIIAIESLGHIWLKTDEETRPRFEAAGSRPFAYPKKTGMQMITSYWSLPDAAIDDPEQVADWARIALAAARRAQIAKVRNPKGQRKKGA